MKLKFFLNVLLKLIKMKTYKKTFDFYATDEQVDTFVYSILDGPNVDPDDDIEVLFDRDIDHRYVTLKIFNRVLH